MRGAMDYRCIIGGRKKVVNTAWGRNLECEMTNAVAQPTTRTCTAWSYDKAECIPLCVVGESNSSAGWTVMVDRFLTMGDRMHAASRRWVHVWWSIEQVECWNSRCAPAKSGKSIRVKYIYCTAKCLSRHVSLLLATDWLRDRMFISCYFH